MLKYFISLLVLISFSAQAKEELFIYNWSDYIAEDTIENFENENITSPPKIFFVITLFFMLCRVKSHAWLFFVKFHAR